MGRTGGRARWASFGAALALVLGAGGVLTSSAATPGTASTFVPITPCRLADTRPGTDNIGTRNTPIGPNDTFTAQVTGTNGNCTIPTTATGVSMNITAIAPTAASFLTVWPTDQTRPLTANLNWTAGQAPTPNAVTATLSTTGAISLYNLSGNVDVTIDIVGYYEPEVSAPAGPQGPPGDPTSIVTVAKSGGDHTTLAAALAAIAASEANPVLIRVGPGTYDEPGGVTVPPYVVVEGSGQDLTVITCACGSFTAPATAGTAATVRVVPSTSGVSVLRDLTVANTGGGGTYAVGVHTADGVLLERVTVTAAGAAASTAVFATGGSGITLADGVVGATGTSGGTSTGVAVRGGASANLSDVLIEVTGGNATAIDAQGGSLDLVDTTVFASGSSATGVRIVDEDLTATGLYVTASASAGAVTGISAQNATVSVQHAMVTASPLGTPSQGIALSVASTATVRNSTISGTTGIRYDQSTILVLSSQVSGGFTAVLPVSAVCRLTTNASFALLTPGCA